MEASLLMKLGVGLYFSSKKEYSFDLVALFIFNLMIKINNEML
jgi:hypothetical protein